MKVLLERGVLKEDIGISWSFFKGRVCHCNSKQQSQQQMEISATLELRDGVLEDPFSTPRSMKVMKI